MLGHKPYITKAPKAYDYICLTSKAETRNNVAELRYDELVTEAVLLFTSLFTNKLPCSVGDLMVFVDKMRSTILVSDQFKY